MQATLTPAPVEPKPEATVTLTMTLSQASALRSFFGYATTDVFQRFLDDSRADGPKPTAEKFRSQVSSPLWSALYDLGV